jgi:hypothetical protein
VSDGTSKVLTYSYEGKSHEKASQGLAWAEYGIYCKTDSDVFLENNVIRTSTLFNGHVVLRAFGGGVDGNLVRYKVDTSFNINVDSQGNLVVMLAQGSPKLENQSQKVDPDIWSKFITLGKINECVDRLQNVILSPIRGFLTGHDQAILNIISGSAAWVFPGAQTFTYKQVYFSDHQDLVTHITYVDPT